MDRLAIPPNPKPPDGEDPLERLERELDDCAESLDVTDHHNQYEEQLTFIARKNNFPPFPANCCIKPCFFIDISVDIPVEFQKSVRMVYYMWIAHMVVLVFNFAGALAYFLTSQDYGRFEYSRITLPLSLLLLLAFPVISFLCWFRPLYKALAHDSDFNIKMFFFFCIIQLGGNIMLCLGIGDCSCGLLNGGEVIALQGDTAFGVGVFMIVVGSMFAALAIMNLVVMYISGRWLIRMVVNKRQGIAARLALIETDLEEGTDSEVR